MGKKTGTIKETLAFIAGLLRPHKRTVAVCSAFAFGAAALDMAAPILLGKGFDLASGKAPWAWYAGALVAWFVLRTVAERVRTYIARRGTDVAENAGSAFVRDTMVEFLHKPLSFHYDRKSQETADKVWQLRYELAYFIESSVFDLVPALLSAAAIVAYVSYLDPTIGVILGLALAAHIWYSAKIAPVWIEKHKVAREADRKMNSAGWDAIRNILVVKSTSGEAAAAKTIEKNRGESLKAEILLSRFNERMFNVQNLIVGASSLIIVLLATRRFASGTFSFGTMTTLTAYTFTVFGYVRYMQWNFRTLMRASADHAAVSEAMRVPAEDYAGGRNIDIRGDVEFRGVRFRYREEKPVLEKVDFACRAGQRIAIVGESGEGKTTLVDLIGRYYSPQSGAVLVDGTDVRELNLRSLRDQMAYVPQDLTLYHDTIGMNIAAGKAGATDDDVRKAAKLAHLDEFIGGLSEKYGTIVGERGLKLSGGERQRVALARAFLRDPRILILDEPTAHLDSKTEEFIQRSLESLMKGRTTFVIAHRLRTVMDADVILVLKEGRIVERGSHDELVKKDGIYAALLRSQGGFLTPEEHHVGDTPA